MKMSYTDKLDDDGDGDCDSYEGGVSASKVKFARILATPASGRASK